MNSMKLVLRFGKSELTRDSHPEKIMELFRSALGWTEELVFFEHLSLASTSQGAAEIGGIDYLFFEGSFAQPDSKPRLVEKLNIALNGQFVVTDIISPTQFHTKSINQYVYYVADLRGIELPAGFGALLSQLLVQDLNGADQQLMVTETRDVQRNGRTKQTTRSYNVASLVPHLHYDYAEAKLYFIAEGHVPIAVLLMGLIFGGGAVVPELTGQVRVNRLDYPHGNQRFLHSSRHYDNITGDYIPLDGSLELY